MNTCWRDTFLRDGTETRKGKPNYVFECTSACFVQMFPSRMLRSGFFPLEEGKLTFASLWDFEGFAILASIFLKRRSMRDGCISSPNEGYSEILLDFFCCSCCRCIGQVVSRLIRNVGPCFEPGGRCITGSGHSRLSNLDC